MTTVKMKIETGKGEQAPIVPVVVPAIEDIEMFAKALHIKGQYWVGEAFGWPAEYNPEKSEPPLDSKMTFTPADFCIGEGGIWFYSLMWENGREAEPVAFLDDRNIVSTL